ARLAPGASAELEMRINTLGQPAGPNAWSVRVAFADDSGSAGEREFRLTARLVRELTVEPAMLVLVLGDKKLTRDLTLTDRRARPLELTAVKTTSERLRAELAGPWRRDGDVWVRTVRVEVSGGERCDADVVLYADDPEYRELRVPVRVSRRS